MIQFYNYTVSEIIEKWSELEDEKNFGSLSFGNQATLTDFFAEVFILLGASVPCSSRRSEPCKSAHYFEVPPRQSMKVIFSSERTLYSVLRYGEEEKSAEVKLWTRLSDCPQVCARHWLEVSKASLDSRALLRSLELQQDLDSETYEFVTEERDLTIIAGQTGPAFKQLKAINKRIWRDFRMLSLSIDRRLTHVVTDSLLSTEGYDGNVKDLSRS